MKRLIKRWLGITDLEKRVTEQSELIGWLEKNKQNIPMTFYTIDSNSKPKSPKKVGVKKVVKKKIAPKK